MQAAYQLVDDPEHALPRPELGDVHAVEVGRPERERGDRQREGDHDGDPDAGGVARPELPRDQVHERGLEHHVRDPRQELPGQRHPSFA